MEKYDKLVYDIGAKDFKCELYFRYTDMPEYEIWRQMLRRCSNKIQEKFPTYTGTTCSENFKSYSYFYEWCHKQVGFGEKDNHGKLWHLDKDLLIKGNKLYSEDTCVFIPHRLNCLLVKSNKSRGDSLIGVCKDLKTGMFIAQCGDGNLRKRSKYLGSFATEEEAFVKYKSFKEGVIKKVAEEYKSSVDSRVYASLMLYEVSSND